MADNKQPTGDFVDLVFGEVTIRFCGCYSPGDPGQHTLSNGDPGYPPTPSEFEWETAWLGDVEVTEMVNQLMGLSEDELAECLIQKYEESVVEDEDIDPPSNDDSDIGLRAGGSA